MVFMRTIFQDIAETVYATVAKNRTGAEFFKNVGVCAAIGGIGGGAAGFVVGGPPAALQLGITGMQIGAGVSVPGMMIADGVRAIAHRLSPARDAIVGKDAVTPELPNPDYKPERYRGRDLASAHTVSGGRQDLSMDEHDRSV